MVVRFLSNLIHLHFHSLILLIPTIVVKLSSFPIPAFLLDVHLFLVYI